MHIPSCAAGTAQRSRVAALRRPSARSALMTLSAEPRDSYLPTHARCSTQPTFACASHIACTLDDFTEPARPFEQMHRMRLLHPLRASFRAGPRSIYIVLLLPGMTARLRRFQGAGRCCHARVSAPKFSNSEAVSAPSRRAFSTTSVLVLVSTGLGGVVPGLPATCNGPTLDCPCSPCKARPDERRIGHDRGLPSSTRSVLVRVSARLEGVVQDLPAGATARPWRALARARRYDQSVRPRTPIPCLVHMTNACASDTRRPTSVRRRTGSEYRS